MKKKRQVDDREAAQIGPRQAKDTKSVAFAWQTVSILKRYYQSKEVSEQRWQETLEEAEKFRIYERVPEGKPYGSLDAMLKAEIGETAATSTEKVKKRAENPKDLHQQHDKTLPSNVNGRGHSADYLTARIARDRPDILERMKAGEFESARAAGIAAGIVKVPAALDVAKKAFAKLSRAEREQFLAWTTEQE